MEESKKSEEIITNSADTFYKFIDELTKVLTKASSTWQDTKTLEAINGLISLIKQEKSDYAYYVSGSLLALNNFQEIYDEVSIKEKTGQKSEPYSVEELSEIIIHFINEFCRSLSNKIIRLQTNANEAINLLQGAKSNSNLVAKKEAVNLSPNRRNLVAEIDELSKKTTAILEQISLIKRSPKKD